MGAKRPPESGPPDFMSDSDPEPDSADPNEGAEGETSDVTPDMLNYHAGSDNCGACSHFTAPSTCDRFSDPVEESAWCKGFQAGGADMGAGDQGAAPAMGVEGQAA